MSLRAESKEPAINIQLINFMDSKKVVVVTGASAGLGRAIVREFAKRGDDVALIARGVDGLEGAKREVESYGGRALVLPLDVADADAVERAAAEIEEKLGPIDVWVNNAMNSVFSPIIDMEPDEYKRVTEVTYLGQVYGCLSAYKRMKPRNKGCIIFVGSALAYRGIPLQSAYCASKHAIQGFYDSFRTELIHDKTNIRTCMVQLPAMNTTQFGFVRSKLPRKPRPMGMIYQPEVAARAVVFATEHDRREIYVGIPTVEAIVGNKIVPGFADWQLARTGFDGQMTDEPEDPHRKDNLWEPIPGDHGAHGPFKSLSHSFSPQLWATENRGVLAGIVALAVGVFGAFLMKK
ncbi:SDR family oxidoreductase [Rubrolithibacter danxiaensis]|uniref:SDR family oxidoreductase n=1 Tax=Rubrolithibacter danxiaensis TaxID=3390805 RepID=UPI003BF78C93